MEYRPILYFANGVPYAEGNIKLDTTNMRDTDGNPTVVVADAADAYLLVDPTAGASIGNDQYRYHINALLETDDYVILHAVEESAGEFTDVDYRRVHKSMAARIAGDIFDEFFLRFAQHAIHDYEDTSLRAWLVSLASDCGYTSAVGAHSLYVFQRVYETMYNDYLVHVAETGIDSAGRFNVKETVDVQWTLTCSNMPGNNQGVQVNAIYLNNNPIPRHFITVPQYIKTIAELSPQIVNMNDYVVIGNHNNIHEMARALRLRPVQYLSVVEETAEHVNLEINLPDQPRSPNEVKRELMALAEAALTGV